MRALISRPVPIGSGSRTQRLEPVSHRVYPLAMKCSNRLPLRYNERMIIQTIAGWNIAGLGEMAERLKAPVSKTGSCVSATWVRIPLSPLLFMQVSCMFSGFSSLWADAMVYPPSNCYVYILARICHQSCASMNNE